MSIAIVTDSTADLDLKYAEENDVTVVPLTVNFGDKSYLDGVDLTTDEFFRKLTESEKLPTTSQVSVGAFEKTYKELAEKYDTIISIHISAELSGTYQAAVIASEEIEGADITPVNSCSVSFGLGFLVKIAVEALKKGANKDQILARLEQAKNRQKIYFSVGTLEYLEKGGRIGKAQALLGTLLSVKPVLTLSLEGIVTPFEKIRGKHKVKKRLEELLSSYIADEGADCYKCIVHSVNEEEALEFKDMLEKKYGFNDMEVGQLGPVVGTHVGPGVLGLALTPRPS